MGKNAQNSDIKDIVKIMSTLHYAYSFAILIFGAITLLITENASFNFDNGADIFLYIVPIFAIGAVFASTFIFNTLLKKVYEKHTLKEKLTAYQTARIIRLALIEGPAILSLVIFLQTTNLFYLLIAAALFIYMIYIRPTPHIIKQDLKLNLDLDKEFREALR